MYNRTLISLLFLLLLFCGCKPLSTNVTNQPDLLRTAQPTGQQENALTSPPALKPNQHCRNPYGSRPAEPKACIPLQNHQKATLIRVVDGDTIYVRLGNDRDEVKIRYIGINTPEVDQTLGDQATELNRALLGKQELTLVRDSENKDNYGRYLRYVLAGDSFVNYELVRRGMAEAIAYQKRDACNLTLTYAQADACRDGLGIWGAP